MDHIQSLLLPRPRARASTVRCGGDADVVRVEVIHLWFYTTQQALLLCSVLGRSWAHRALVVVLCASALRI
eukprot:10467423-Lingulodinium_polyedra.AAC.1